MISSPTCLLFHVKNVERQDPNEVMIAPTRFHELLFSYNAIYFPVLVRLDYDLDIGSQFLGCCLGYSICNESFHYLYITAGHLAHYTMDNSIGQKGPFNTLLFWVLIKKKKKYDQLSGPHFLFYPNLFSYYYYIPPYDRLWGLTLLNLNSLNYSLLWF